jgi:hypothetical protein
MKGINIVPDTEKMLKNVSLPSIFQFTSVF